MVIGSRYVEGGATPEWPHSRKIASKLATLPARLFTDVNDPLAGFFATSTRRLQNIRTDVPGFKIGLEVLAVGGDDLRVFEVPIVFHDRFEESRENPLAGRQARNPVVRSEPQRRPSRHTSFLGKQSLA